MALIEEKTYTEMDSLLRSSGVNCDCKQAWVKVHRVNLKQREPIKHAEG